MGYGIKMEQKRVRRHREPVVEHCYYCKRALPHKQYKYHVAPHLVAAVFVCRNRRACKRQLLRFAVAHLLATE